MLGLFEGELQKMVALAVLAPIVASQGGNAATQTMTIAVRALATRELSDANAWRVILRELMVGMLNGIAFAVITGVVAYAWFKVPGLGMVIGLAMICNLIAAALGGILIPLAMHAARLRSGGRLRPVRHHGDRRGRVLLVPRDRDAVVRAEVACPKWDRFRIRPAHQRYGGASSASTALSRAAGGTACGSSRLCPNR